MSDDLSIPRTDGPRDQEPLLLTDLVAVPDDPDEPTEVMIQPEDASIDDLATEWITVAADDLVDVEESR